MFAYSQIGMWYVTAKLLLAFETNGMAILPAAGHGLNKLND